MSPIKIRKEIHFRIKAYYYFTITQFVYFEQIKKYMYLTSNCFKNSFSGHVKPNMHKM